MAEDSGTTDTVTTDGATPDGGSEDVTGLKNALQSERDARKAAEKAAKEGRDAARQLQELEDAKKSETEKLTDKLTSAETERDQLAGENVRLRVAIEKGVPADLAARLQGSTREELEEDADTLLKLVTPAETQDVPAGTPRENLRPGATPRSSVPLNGDPLLQDIKSKLGIR